MKLIHISTFAALGFLASWMSGCSPVKFNADPSAASVSADCQSTNNCVTAQGTTYSYDVKDSLLPVDILFVSDNSGSMSKDQQTLGSQFPSLFSMISGYDYRVAVTTTDVSGTGLNGRDGTLATDGDGSSYITPSTSNPTSVFASKVQRQETIACDAYLKTEPCASTGQCSAYSQMCPSPDSRAIYAANMVATNNPNSFLRSSAPLHVIILSNSDERGGGPSGPYYGPNVAGDEPQTLVSTINTMFPGKTIKVHTLIIQPNDSGCLADEHQTQFIFGQYAPLYASASSITGGVAGSICANPYDAQLQQIGLDASNDLQQNIPLNCATSNANLTYTFTPSSSITATVDSTGKVLNLSSPLPANTTLHLSYTCN